VAEGSTPSSRARRLGAFLVACGLIGVVTGLVPFVIALARLAGLPVGGGRWDWLAHGMRELGLSAEWAALSSASGTFLGILLVAAGIGWRSARPWAPLLSLLYALDGLVVTGTDLAVFVVAARPGPMRKAMIAAESLAFGLALAVLLGLAVWWSRQRSTRHPSA